MDIYSLRHFDIVLMQLFMSQYILLLLPFFLFMCSPSYLYGALLSDIEIVDHVAF